MFTALTSNKGIGFGGSLTGVPREKKLGVNIRLFHSTQVIQIHWFALFDHSNCTVYFPICLVFQAQISPISPLESSYQPCPGMGSVMASHNSCELVEVSASNGCKPPVQPAHPGYGMTA